MNEREQHFLRRIDLLLERLSAEAQAPQPDVPADDVRYLIERIREMKQSVEAGGLPPRGHRHKTLTRLVIDQWPLDHPLTNDVVEVENQFTKL